MEGFLTWLERNYLKASLIVAALLVLLLGSAIWQAANAQTVPTGSLTASPKTLAGAGNVTLTWNLQNASNCVASGAWTGAKAASGTQVVPVTGSAQFFLKCDGPAPTTVLGWTLATKNTDGSTLTDLASTKLYESSASTGTFTNVLATVNVPANSYTTTALAPGTHYFQASSVNAAGTESATRAGPISVTVPATASATFSDAVTVTTVPNPPSNFAVTIATIAYELREYSGGTLRFVQVGTVPLGVDCPGAKLAGAYRAFGDAKLTRPTTGGIIAAKCG